MSKIILCVNVDHVATLRQARGGIEPDPVEAAKICEKSGADGITIHLREDRRHIQDADVFAIKKIVKGKFNLEMALSKEIIEIAKEVSPDQVTLVPEKREEITTEGGLNIKSNFNDIKKVIDEFHQKDIIVSLFIEPDIEAVQLSGNAGADYIEIHTGTYCNARDKSSVEQEVSRIYKAAEHAAKLGLRVNAGHGLNYININSVLKTPALEELNIGHSIISRSVFTGIGVAVKDMIKLIN